MGRQELRRGGVSRLRGCQDDTPGAACAGEREVESV